jgi:hypothetical protein
VPRLVGIDTDRTGNATDHLATAYDVGNTFFIDTILEGYDEAVRGQVLLDHHRGPFGIVRLGTDEGDIYRLLEQALHLVQVERLESHCVLSLGATQMDAVVLDILDMFRPGVDQSDILTRAGEVPTDVAPDCTRSHKDNALAHTTPLLHDHAPAVQAMSSSELWSGIVAWHPGEYQPQVS